jgi:peptidoglycan/xylan/chitin deacetylase (PgdA/CDA1 family)
MRVAWRRCRARWADLYVRRRVAAGGLLIAIVATVALLVSGGASGHRANRHLASSATGIAGVAVPDRDRSLARPAHPTANWATGAAAAGLAVDRVLSYTAYIRIGTARRREVALTFDDGPGRYTARILRVLARVHAPGTFFVIGEWARAYPGLVRAEAREGSEIGDHTETHPFISALAAPQQLAQIAQAAAAISGTGAPSPVLWRPPYGAFNQTTIRILRDLRMLIVLWTVDTSDYARPGVARIVYTALSGARPGAIILMHDGGGDRSETVAALPRIIAGLRRHGFRLVTVSRLLADDPPPRGQPPAQPLTGVG